jgi:hypothetical protein
MMKCATCNGVYRPDQRGGYRYFHACPPVFDAGKQDYIERADKRDENVTGAILLTVIRKGQEIEIALADLQHGDVEKSRRSPMKREGKGALGVVDAPVIDVPA